MEQNIHLTPKAIEKVKAFLAQDQSAHKGLRIYVEGGGCSGFQYGFSIDAPGDEDQVAEVSGVRIIIDPISLPYIQTSTVDYHEGLMNAGFVVKNPNAKTSCGCGLSFNL